MCGHAERSGPADSVRTSADTDIASNAATCAHHHHHVPHFSSPYRHSSTHANPGPHPDAGDIDPLFNVRSIVQPDADGKFNSGNPEGVGNDDQVNKYTYAPLKHWTMRKREARAGMWL